MAGNLFHFPSSHNYERMWVVKREERGEAILFLRNFHLPSSFVYKSLVIHSHVLFTPLSLIVQIVSMPYV